NGYCWVDQYKLSLSTMTGGWVHFHVMDCFSKMLSCHQQLIANLEGHIHQKYFEQNTVNILMTKSLNLECFKVDFLELVGFSLYNAGLVHIPCFNLNQWLLIVANFMHNNYNVIEFQLQYISVPKYKFRYDSGIYRIQFMQTYNGTRTVAFSNEDVIVIRAKFLYQLCTSQFNKTKSEFIRKFLKDNNKRARTYDWSSKVPIMPKL
uniref:Ubiquitin-like protease family profile domain-containing protein n=1 Tax=Setaria italica TaxID=4555 RepID=K3YM99_SETIT